MYIHVERNLKVKLVCWISGGVWKLKPETLAMQYYSKQLRQWKWNTKLDDIKIYAVIAQGTQSVSSDIFEELKRDR